MYDQLNDRFKVNTEALLDSHWRRVESQGNTNLSIDDVLTLLAALENIVENKQSNWQGVDVVVEAIRRDGYVDRDFVNRDPQTARVTICRYNNDLARQGWKLSGRSGVYDLVKS